MAENENKRFFRRFMLSGTIMVTPDTLDEARTVNGELIDLSFKGGGFFSKDQLKNGERVLFLLANDEMGIRLRGTAKIVCVSKVRRDGEEQFRYGIAFSNLDSAALRDIVRNLEQRARQASQLP